MAVAMLPLLLLLISGYGCCAAIHTVLWCNRIVLDSGHIFHEIMPATDFTHVWLHDYRHNATVASYVGANPPRVLGYNIENSGKDANYSEIRILIDKYKNSLHVLIHMSDEFNGSGKKYKYGEGIELYRIDSIKLVLRQYGVFPYVGTLGLNNTRKVVQLLLEPNQKLLDGVRASQPGKIVTTASFLQGSILRNLSDYNTASRVYNWSFLGLVGNRQGRRALINTFLEWHNHSFHEGIGVLPPDMFEIYRKSKFVVIGRGQANLDCFRIYEAILAGAVPIMVGPPQEVQQSLDYNGDAPPLPVMESPDAAVALCKSLSDSSIDDLRYGLATWYVRKVAMIRGALYRCLEGTPAAGAATPQPMSDAAVSRALSEIHPTDKYHEHPAKKVRNTTNKDLFPLLKTLLYTKMANSSNLFINTTLDYISREKIDVLVGTLEKAVSETGKSALLDLRPGVNDFNAVISTATNVATKKWAEEHVMNNFEGEYNDEAKDGMFNIVVLTGNSTSNVNFLNKWFKWIKNMELIIVQQGDPHRFVQVPSWARFELHTRADIEKVVGKNDMWVFDIDGDGSQAATYGFLVADRDFVFLLDRHCEPLGIDGGTNMLYLHARNLLKPSLPFYYTSPRRDPVRGHGSDFSRGYPYSLRDGIQTGISFGEVVRPGSAGDADSLTRLVKPGSSAAVDGHTNNGTAIEGEKELVVTIGHKAMFSLSTKNVVYNRRLLGSSFFLLHAISARAIFEVHPDYFDMLAGWILKVVADHVGFGIKHIVSPVQMQYASERADSSALYDELRGDYLWLQYHEKLVRYFNTVQLSKGKAENDIGLSMGELVGKLAGDLPYLRPVFVAIGDMYRIYGSLFNRYTGFHTGLLPVASRSTYQPREDSPHKCAAYTIVHNDTNMLNVWMRYYTKYFANATFVYTHFISSEDERNSHNYIEADLYHRFQNKMHNFTLYGENVGFPMGFFVSQADLIQRRLFRYGYKCVLLSDIDEIVVPDPDVYPSELNGYLVSFMNKSDKYFRVNAFALAHISESDAGDNKSVEPALDWSRGILGQRSYIYSQNKYCKPLLSKVPMRHKPGFHATFVPGFVPSDNDLYMFHLKDVDRETCLSREVSKNKLFREKGRQSDINKLLNTHILHHRTDFCQFAMGIYSTKLNGAYDSTGKLKLAELKASFKKILV